MHALAKAEEAETGKEEQKGLGASKAIAMPVGIEFTKPWNGLEVLLWLLGLWLF